MEREIAKNKYNLSNLRQNNLLLRTITAIILLPIAIYIIYFSASLVFAATAILITVIMAFEWYNLTKNSNNYKKWELVGIAYISIPIISMLILKELNQAALLCMFLIVWITDISAYFVGKKIGGPKLLPSVSPNKTWSGSIAGIVLSMILGSIISLLFYKNNVVFIIVISGIFSILEQLGDLFESKLKRMFNVKDSGTIIPGHGGVLDRLDGLTFLSPIMLIVVLIYSK